MKTPINIKVYIIIAVAVIALLVFIYFAGRKSAKTNIQQVELPSDQPGGYKLSISENALVNEIAQSLYKDMKGLTLFSRDTDNLERLLSTNDTVFVAVYNQFNKIAALDNDGSLREWLNSEVGGFWDQLYDSLRASIIKRMDRLNLV